MTPRDVAPWLFLLAVLFCTIEAFRDFAPGEADSYIDWMALGVACLTGALWATR